jgi:hypothetical protein
MIIHKMATRIQETKTLVFNPKKAIAWLKTGLLTHQKTWFLKNSSPGFKYKLLLYFSLIVTTLLLTPPVLAIGPGTGGSKIRINDEQHGPFILLVATSPLPVAVGQMSIWVRVTGLQDNQLRRDAKVLVEATPTGGGSPITAEGTHQNAGNDFDYVAHVAVDQPGQWDVKVSISDALGETEIAFRETVTRGRTTAALIGLAIPFIVLALVVGIYLWRRSSVEGTPA